MAEFSRYRWFSATSTSSVASLDEELTIGISDASSHRRVTPMNGQRIRVLFTTVVMSVGLMLAGSTTALAQHRGGGGARGGGSSGRSFSGGGGYSGGGNRFAGPSYGGRQSSGGYYG